MRVIDTTEGIFQIYDSGDFDIDRWKKYMDSCVPGAKDLCLSDMQEGIDAGFPWETSYLPVLDAVIKDKTKFDQVIKSFNLITEHLEEKIIERFGKSVDADVILYLGLCNGAGWVTPVDGKTTVLLGIEKILELNWQDIDHMTGLIIHELGHAYQDQYGILKRKFDNNPDKFLWQLFTEGIAMVFEQEIAGSPEYFHQYDEEWKKWCDKNINLIRKSFSDDLECMTNENQRYFGDWVRFKGYGDTGYYLGARFVRFLLGSDTFNNIICYDINDVKTGFERCELLGYK